MTLDEKLARTNRPFELLNEGTKRIYSPYKIGSPAPYMAKVAKEMKGADFLVDGGWNLSEAEAEFGTGCLVQ